MAWTTPGTAVAGTVYTSAFYNEQTRDNLNYLYSPPMCLVQRTTALTGYTSNTDITWSSERYDTDAMFSSGTDITIKTAGIYLVNCHIEAYGNATISRISPRIHKNGNVSVAQESPVNASTGTNTTVSIVSSFAVNDTITLRVLFTGGSAYAIGGSATEDNVSQTRLSVTWLGKNP